jgi:hypothetical protein
VQFRWGHEIRSDPGLTCSAENRLNWHMARRCRERVVNAASILPSTDRTVNPAHSVSLYEEDSHER